MEKRTVLVGDNNVGKSTILEAIDLVLGPARLRRRPVVDEHDFYNGKYISEIDNSPRIEVELVVIDLNNEQKARFSDNLEFWNDVESRLFDDEIGQVDTNGVDACLRVSFHGYYDKEEDDFVGHTFFSRAIDDSGASGDYEELVKKNRLTLQDKRNLPFLYLRTLRTGRRALSLEHGSLLDVILRIKEITPEKMWETILDKLRKLDVIEDPNLEINSVLSATGESLRKLVPSRWGEKPQLRVSSLTREHLRQVIVAFLETSENGYAVPYDRQGTGTVNMLVLALLTQIAEDRSVVFAMEEPEIAIPPYTQKQVVQTVKRLASQALFTSHSPHVIEVFDIDETVVLADQTVGKLARLPIKLPTNMKLKRYRDEFRTGLCEALLSRNVFIVEGKTEANAMPAVAQRLSEIDSTKYSSLEALGITTLNAQSDGNIAGLAEMFLSLKKTVFVFCDQQKPEQEGKIKDVVPRAFIHVESGFEDLIAKNTTEEAKKRFMTSVGKTDEDFRDYLVEHKGDGTASDFLMQCDEDEIPACIRNCCGKLQRLLMGDENSEAVGDSNESD